MAVANLVAKVDAQVATFQKQFAEASRTAQKFEKDFANTASSVTAQQKRITEAFSSFSGDKLAREATAVAKAVEQVGGASKLTATEQARVNALMTEAISKYAALGQTAPKALLDLEQATKKVVTATAEVPKQLSLAERATGLLSGAFGQFTAAGLVSNAISGITASVTEFIAKGSQLQSVETSFFRLSTAAKQSGSDILTSMRGATRGMVSDLDLMLGANKALLLGLPVTAQSMGELSEAATKLGKAMGLDATKSLDDLITALGRSSPLILDNLGLSVKLGEANDAYAKKLGTTGDALTESERKTAFYEAAMEAARKKTKELGDQTKTLGEIMQTAWVGVGNVITRFSSNVNTGIGSALSSMKSFAAFSQDLIQFGAATAIANAALREQIAQSRASAVATDANALAARNFVKELERTLNLMPALTAEGKKQYEAALKLGASTEEITKRFGLSEIQQKLLAESMKTGTKALKDSAQAQKEYAKLLADDVVRSYEEARVALQSYYDMIRKANTGITEGLDGLTFRKNTEVKVLDGLAGEWLKYRDIIDSVNSKVRLGVDSAPGTHFGGDALAGIWGKDETRSRDRELKKAEQFGKQLSQTIIGAIQGGGDIGKAIGAQLGSSLGEEVGKKLAKSIGGTFGSVLGGLAGPLGAIGGQLLGGVFDKVFGSKGRDMVKAFAESQGGFDVLQKKIEALGPGSERLWVNLTQGVGKNNPQQAQAAIDAVTAALEKSNAAAQQLPPTFADVAAAAQRYGLEVDKIGDGINSLRVMEFATQAVKDWELLARAGADLEQVAAGMADEMQALVIESGKFGHALPEAMRPILQKMIDMGLLTDDAGNKLQDLTGLHFERPLADAIDGLIGKMDQLIDKISTGLGGALRGLPSDLNINVPQLGSGGIVTRPTLALIGESGPEAVVPLGGSATSFGGDERPIVVQTFLDGRQVAEVTAEHLPHVLRRRGAA